MKRSIGLNDYVHFLQNLNVAEGLNKHAVSNG